MNRATSATVLALSALLSAWLLPCRAAAQQPMTRDTAQLRRAAEARLGRPIGQAEILDRLRQSRLTRAQARARLQQMGYDPSLVDPYYDALEGGQAPAGQPSSSFLSALERIGVSARVSGAGAATDSMAADTMAEDTAVADSLSARPASAAGLQAFGRSLFERRTN